jgi:hypothetical protein
MRTYLVYELIDNEFVRKHTTSPAENNFVQQYSADLCKAHLFALNLADGNKSRTLLVTVAHPDKILTEKQLTRIGARINANFQERKVRKPFRIGEMKIFITRDVDWHFTAKQLCPTGAAGGDSGASQAATKPEVNLAAEQPFVKTVPIDF